MLAATARKYVRAGASSRRHNSAATPDRYYLTSVARVAHSLPVSQRVRRFLCADPGHSDSCDAGNVCVAPMAL